MIPLMARWTQRNTILSLLECEECGNLAPIQRRRGQERPLGHIKHMWCYRCRSITAHIELRRDEEARRA